MRLSHRDFGRLSTFLLDLYAFRDHEAFVRHTIHALHRLLPCDRVAYNEISLKKKKARIWWSPEDKRTQERLLPVFEKRMHEHPGWSQVSTPGKFNTGTISDHWTLRQFKDQAIYQEFYGKLETNYQLWGTTHVTPSFTTLFTLSRRLRDFSEADRFLLDFLRPHFRQALHNATAVSHLQNRFDRACTAFHLTAFQVDENGLVLREIGEASRGFFPYWGVEVHAGDVLPAEVQQWMDHRRAELMVGPAPDATPSPLVRSSDRGTLILHLLREDNAFWILMKESRHQAPVERLKRFGLTAREADVLNWVAGGKTNEDVAAILGMKQATVKKHLERIYIKLGVDNRMAASAMVREQPNPFGPD